LVPSSGRWGSSGTGGPTECWTLSMSEAVRCTEHPDCPNGGDASSLWAILEDGSVPQRYSLTGAACAKALERIAKRGGKSLTPMMRAELEKKASQ
jgi:hypothetical protein